MAAAVRRRLPGAATPAPEPAPVPVAPEPAPPVAGMVEEFSRKLVAGWVSVPADAPPVRVELWLNKFRISATYATRSRFMSGSGSELRNRTDPWIRKDAPSDGTVPASGAEGLLHHWQAPPLPGPRNDRRNTRDELRIFAFRVRGIWPYVNRRTRIEVRVDGRPLPVHRHGTFVRPPRNGKRSIAELRKLFREGYVLTQMGRVELSKQLDTEWQEATIRLYDVTREVVRETLGADAFVVYGTLLGAVRDGGYIGHDADFDCAYVSGERTAEAVVEELVGLCLALVARGLDVELRPAVVHISDPERPGHRIDLFHTWFDHDGRLRMPFGVAGGTDFSEDRWDGCREVDFPGGRVLVPVAAEELVEHIYGEDWRRPRPGFNWDLERTDAAADGLVAQEQRTKVYWANFYSRHEYASGSTFFDFVAGLEDRPARVIDIGCGDGRDSCAFGRTGSTVLGLDQSPVGVAHATQHAQHAGIEDRVAFRTCDVGDPDEIRAALAAGRGGSDEPVLFYLRFFLHAIPEDVQKTLLDAVAAAARPGDLFAAEFRTDKDEQLEHVHTKHYRRFQPAQDVADAMAERGFTVEHLEEGTGLSPYESEDPVLCRLLARAG